MCIVAGIVSTGKVRENQMATEQAFYAMVAARRLEEGHSALYDMNEVE